MVARGNGTGLAITDRHARERQRLEALRSYDILETPSEDEFDEIAALAARICEAPIALISFVGEREQWFKARVGLEADRTDLVGSVCAHAILGDDVLEIVDTSLDARTADNPWSLNGMGMRFYAGVPLVTAGGLPLGTLCVIDRRPRKLDEGHLEALRVLGRQVVTQLELRRALRAQSEAARRAEEQGRALERSLATAETLRLEIDHRVKNSLQLVSSLLAMQAARTESAEVRQALGAARGRVLAISSIHAALNLSDDAARVPLVAYAARLVDDLQSSAPAGVRIALDADDVALSSAQASSLAILLNEFVTNSLKYAFPDGREGLVRLEIRVAGDRVRARFADDGVGHSAGAGPPAGEGLGTRIMRAVGGQLGAELDFVADVTGTSLAFEFPLRPPA